MSTWPERLTTASPQHVLSYEDLRDIYAYLRSTRKLLDKTTVPIAGRSSVMTSALNTHPGIYKIATQIEQLFTNRKFANVKLINKVVAALTKEKLGPEKTYQERLKELNVKNIKQDCTKEEKKGKQYLVIGARKTRATNWQYRLQVAISEALKDGWYPIFATYTVDPRRLPRECKNRDELWTKTSAWDRFIKRFKTEIADATNQGRKPSKWKNGETFFKYMAVLEHGATGNHPHVHCIFLCRNIPQAWKKDPNDNCRAQTEVDIPEASSLWHYGAQKKTMALFIHGSPFRDKLKWKIPRDEKTGEPRKVGDSGGVAGYIGKYLTKGGDSKKWKHRVKATHGIGMKSLTNKLHKVTSLGLLMTLACRPPNYSTNMKMQNASEAPLSLIRENARKELVKRLHSAASTRAKHFLKEHWTKRQSKLFFEYIRSVKAGLKPWKWTREQRFNFFTRIMEEANNTAHSKQRVEAVCEWLCYNMPRTARSAPYVLLRGQYSI